MCVQDVLSYTCQHSVPTDDLTDCQNPQCTHTVELLHALPYSCPDCSNIAQQAEESSVMNNVLQISSQDFTSSQRALGFAATDDEEEEIMRRMMELSMQDAEREWREREAGVIERVMRESREEYERDVPMDNWVQRPKGWTAEAEDSYAAGAAVEPGSASASRREDSGADVTSYQAHGRLRPSSSNEYAGRRAIPSSSSSFPRSGGHSRATPSAQKRSRSTKTKSLTKQQKPAAPGGGSKPVTAALETRARWQARPDPPPIPKPKIKVGPPSSAAPQPRRNAASTDPPAPQLKVKISPKPALSAPPQKKTEQQHTRTTTPLLPAPHVPAPIRLHPLTPRPQTRPREPTELNIPTVAGGRINPPDSSPPPKSSSTVPKSQNKPRESRTPEVPTVAGMRIHAQAAPPLPRFGQGAPPQHSGKGKVPEAEAEKVEDGEDNDDDEPTPPPSPRTLRAIRMKAFAERKTLPESTD